MIQDRFKAAHKHSSIHRNELKDSQICGCFYCLQTFPPSKIEEWVDDEQTAICPECGIDSVIGDKSNYPITKEFLQGMNKSWF